MGNSTSKVPPGPSHIWQRETPVRFSQNLVDTLESSTETDSTRAQTLELHIQARVAAELKRLQEREDQTFRDLTAKLSSPPSEEDESSADASDPSGAAEGDRLRTLNRAVIQHSIDDLKHKLESRRKVVEVGALDRDVERAREGVVSCLRGNDRRPLDCWKEVERFREEVRRVESKWVEKIVR